MDTKKPSDEDIQRILGGPLAEAARISAEHHHLPAPVKQGRIMPATRKPEKKGSKK